MASSSRKLSYHKLKNEDPFQDSHDEMYNLRENWIGKARRYRRFHMKKKFKIKIPWFRRLVSRKVKMGWTKVLKRLKESRSHFGDLFAGNYLFMQVTPTPFKAFTQKSFKEIQDFNGLSSRNSSFPGVIYSNTFG